MPRYRVDVSVSRYVAEEVVYEIEAENAREAEQNYRDGDEINCHERRNDINDMYVNSVGEVK